MIGVYVMLLAVMLYIGIPVGVVYLIVKVVQHATTSKEDRGKAGITHTTSITRDVCLAFLVLSGIFVGLITLYAVPTQLFGLTSEAGKFVTQLILGIVTLLLGLAVSGVTRIFLMTVGVSMLVLASPYVFVSFGSAAALLALFVAMIVLIAVTIRLSTHGSIREKKS